MTAFSNYDKVWQAEIQERLIRIVEISDKQGLPLKTPRPLK
jgi:hypothetical protein